MHPREKIITPEVVGTFLDKYEVPLDQRQLMTDIIGMYLTYADDPPEFAKRARVYTETQNVHPLDAQAALRVFGNVRNDIHSILSRVSKAN